MVADVPSGLSLIHLQKIKKYLAKGPTDSLSSAPHFRTETGHFLELVVLEYWTMGTVQKPNDPDHETTLESVYSIPVAHS
jgi:hypothetical protein